MLLRCEKYAIFYKKRCVTAYNIFMEEEIFRRSLFFIFVQNVHKESGNNFLMAFFNSTIFFGCGVVI